MRASAVAFALAVMLAVPTVAQAVAPGDEVTYSTSGTPRTGTVLVVTDKLDLIARKGTISTQDQVPPDAVTPVATPTPTPTPTPSPTPTPTPTPTSTPTPAPTDTPTATPTPTATDTPTPTPVPTDYLFADDFDGQAGTPPDPAKWSVYSGSNPTHWGVECFTNSPDNIVQDGEGHLVLTARREATTPCGYDGSGAGYTSGGMSTGSDGVLFKYQSGTAAASIKVPCQSGTGMWPAWWSSGAQPGMAWPTDGEIDHLEVMKDAPLHPQATIHGPNGTGSWQLGKIGPAIDCTSFHEYSTQWGFGQIDAYVDGVAYAHFTADQMQAGWGWPFDLYPERLLVDLQIGSWGGAVTDATLPQQMVVDYVRVSR